MSIDNLDPMQDTAIEDLHRGNWIVEKKLNKEYGRVLAAARKHQFGAMFENAYLNRLDEACVITSGAKDWIALGSILTPFKQDVEMFKWIANSEQSIGVDDTGHIYVSHDMALAILQNDRDSFQRKYSIAINWVLILALLLVVVIVLHYA